MKLGLGTAQFGLNYGVSNKLGQTPISEARRIVEYAHQHDVRVIDTATAYGTSEESVGEILHDLSMVFQIVTKIPKMVPMRHSVSDWVRSVFQTSLSKLKQRSVYSLMVHYADDLLGEFGAVLYNAILELKQKGLVDKIGASIYTGEQIDALLERYHLDIIQVPVNVFDQRLIHSGHLAVLRRLGIEVHARSTFLQGLLLMRDEEIPSYFDPHRRHIVDYLRLVEASALSPAAVALGFVIWNTNIDRVICGVNNLAQLQELLAICEKPPSKNSLHSFLRFSSGDVGLVDPSVWRL